MHEYLKEYVIIILAYRDIDFQPISDITEIIDNARFVELIFNITCDVGLE